MKRKGLVSVRRKVRQRDKSKEGVMKNIAIIFILLSTAAVVSAQPFSITRSAVISGGRASGGTFAVDSTSGESGCGGASGGGFSLTSGYYGNATCPPALAPPTAAAVSITGRVTTAKGNGIRNARLVLTSPDGTRRTAITSSFGYYAFDGIEVGHTYVLEIASKRYTFANPTRIFSLQDTLADLDFVAEPQ